MEHKAVLLLSLLVGVLAGVQGDFTCKATVYTKPGANDTVPAKDKFSVSLTANGSVPAFAYQGDFRQLPKPPSAESWDDRVNSARLECTCAAGTASCAAFWPKVKARFFADPWPRKTKGGPFTDLTCTTSDARKCSGLFDRMPDKWNGRTSGMAVVFDRDDFTLPRSDSGSGTGAAPPRPPPSPSGGKGKGKKRPPPPAPAKDNRRPPSPAKKKKNRPPKNPKL